MLLLAALLLVLAPPAQAGGAWRWPLHGPVLTPFHVTAHPFAPGQHRGIDIAAAAGAHVRSACPGRVHFAGRVPGRGRVVTVRCGPLVATYLELGRVLVRRGDEVGPGALLGTVAASHLQLGARRAGDRGAYVDPLTLLRDRSASPPLGVVPKGSPLRPTPRSPPRTPPRPAAPPLAAPTPAAAPVTAPRVPPLAWLGLALLAAGTPLGALAERRRRTRRRPPALNTRTADEGA